MEKEYYGCISVSVCDAKRLAVIDQEEEKLFQLRGEGPMKAFKALENEKASILEKYWH